MIRYSLAIDIPDDILDKRVKKANSWLQEEIIDDTDQFVPMRTGALAGTVYRDGNEIVYAMPYARYMYYGKVMVDPKTGAAGFLAKNPKTGALEWKSRKNIRKKLTDRPIHLADLHHIDAVFGCRGYLNELTADIGAGPVEFMAFQWSDDKYLDIFPSHPQRHKLHREGFSGSGSS